MGQKRGEEKEELGENIKIYVDLNVGSSGKYTNILVQEAWNLSALTNRHQVELLY